jgi:hypothetical protein
MDPPLVNISGLAVLGSFVILLSVSYIIPSPYLRMFCLFYILSYTSTCSHRVSTLVALFLVYLQILYRYYHPDSKKHQLLSCSVPSLLACLCVLALSPAIQRYEDTLCFRVILYIMVVYLAVTIFEWTIHKYVMHCYSNWPWLDTTDCSFGIVDWMRGSCRLHKDHHLSVNADMTLKGIKHNGELLFGWPTLFACAVVILCVSSVLNSVLGLNIPFGTQTLIVTSFILGFAYVWNGIHPSSHGIKLAGAPGRYAPGMDVELSKQSVHYKNHEIHHGIKGNRKGNFNVVFLGGDELFDTNRLVSA